MRKLGLLLCVALLLGQSSFAYGRERNTIPNKLRGVWTMHMMSKDEGATVTVTDPPERLCKVWASKVRLSGGDIYKVKKVKVMKSKKHKKGSNLILFHGGAVWAVSKLPRGTGTRGPGPYYLVQVIDQKRGKEMIRFMVTIR